MKKFLRGLCVGIILTSALGIVGAMATQRAAVKAEQQASRAEAAVAEAAAHASTR